MENNNNNTLPKRNFISIILFALLSAFCIISFRNNYSTIITISNINFAFTDFFIIIATGICGLETGLLSFVILFISEFFRETGTHLGLYSVFIYLLLVLVTARQVHFRKFKTLSEALFSAFILALILAISWLFSFSILIPDEVTGNVFQGSSFLNLFLGALPESIIAGITIFLFFKLVPDNLKCKLGIYWLCKENNQTEKKQFFILERRLIVLSLIEALILCVVAIILNSFFEATANKVPFCLNFFINNWKIHVRMALLMLCAAIPIAYLLNQYVMYYIINPITAMSLVMERYFDTDENNREKSLPNLNIRSGDEIEGLYHSLQKMVKDMAGYIDKMLEQEKKSAHLTHGFMLALAKSVDAKDRYTSGHSVRVAQYSKEIAKRLGKSEAEQEQIYIMGLLHDIGKIGVPEAIINKNGKLTDEEFAKIKEHPIIGHEILKNVTEIPGLATGARWHHERFDGKGYPDGLSSKDIPEEARIIAVADAYDAMTSNRAYSKVRPQEDVRKEIIRCKGMQFDPTIADIMVEMIDNDTKYSMREHTPTS